MITIFIIRMGLKQKTTSYRIDRTGMAAMMKLLIGCRVCPDCTETLKEERTYVEKQHLDENYEPTAIVVYYCGCSNWWERLYDIEAESENVKEMLYPTNKPVMTYAEQTETMLKRTLEFKHSTMRLAMTMTRWIWQFRGRKDNVIKVVFGPVDNDLILFESLRQKYAHLLERLEHVEYELDSIKARRRKAGIVLRAQREKYVMENLPYIPSYLSKMDKERLRADVGVKQDSN